LPWLASLDRAKVEAHALGLAARVRTELHLPQEDSAIVSIPTAAAEKLKDAGIRASIRAGAVRVGFHLYNTEDDLDRLLDVLR
jgi:selenocysteine lyase/cysteine desulfurase